MKSVRCAIYTRKSTEEGLDQEFNSLDAQRESGEAYVTSMKHEGWQCLPDPYDDGGFSGVNMQRPALRRLMLDINAGNIDCVVVYKVDRLSRSLLDFARMMETFEKHNISFVSVTQQFNTGSSMGRLILNVLLSFAQFERDMISERTQDKMAATRRKGKYCGGRPILGYDVVEKKLVVNDIEADRVRQIFALYLEHGAMLPTVQELTRRGWTTKRYVTKTGKSHGGTLFNKGSLHNLLTNVVYSGKVRHKDAVYDGEHNGIISDEVFELVQALLKRNGQNGGRDARNKHGALLRGLLRCGNCGCAMSHSFSTKGSKRYRYYVCTHAQKHGWSTCPAPSVPAGEIERFVLEQIAQMANDPELIQATFLEVQRESKKRIGNLKNERTSLKRQVRRDVQETRQLAICGIRNEAFNTGLADLDEQIRLANERLAEIERELEQLADDDISTDDVATALADFESLWDVLTPRERVKIIELLIERIDFHGADGHLDITFRPTGIKTLTAEREEVAA